MTKMKEGLCDGLMLAYAGVHRMGYEQHIISRMSLETFTPAAGQGALAIEASIDSLDKKVREQIKSAVNHAPTETRLLAERSFLRHIDGGCSIPAFILANLDGNQLHIHAGIVSLNGKQVVREDFYGDAQNPEKAGLELGKLVMASGGQEILEEIRSES